MGAEDGISNFISTNVPWTEISKGPVLSYKLLNKWHIYNKSKHVASMKFFFSKNELKIKVQVNPYVNIHCVINYAFYSFNMDSYVTYRGLNQVLCGTS